MRSRCRRKQLTTSCPPRAIWPVSGLNMSPEASVAARSRSYSVADSTREVWCECGCTATTTPFGRPRAPPRCRSRRTSPAFSRHPHARSSTVRRCRRAENCAAKSRTFSTPARSDSYVDGSVDPAAAKANAASLRPRRSSARRKSVAADHHVAELYALVASGGNCIQGVIGRAKPLHPRIDRANIRSRLPAAPTSTSATYLPSRTILVRLRVVISSSWKSRQPNVPGPADMR